MNRDLSLSTINIGNSDPTTLRVVNASDDPLLTQIAENTGLIGRTFFDTYLKNGGSRDVNVDGSSVNVTFSYTVPSSTELYIENIQIIILDGSLDSDDYGGIINGLTNGCEIYYKVTSGGSNIYVGNTDVDPVQENADYWGIHFRGDINQQPSPNYFRCDLDLRDSPIVLSATGSINFVVKDNLTTIDRHYCTILGYTKVV